MTNLLRDFRFAFRLLCQNKTFTAIAVLALALGVGPNTAIFSVIYATLYAPMPYPKADQLVMVWSKIQGNRNGIAAGDFLDWQKQSKSFQGLWAWSGFDANLGGGESPEQVPGTQSTPGQLTGLGVPPVLGRDFRSDEDQPGKDHVVVFSNRLWQRRFGGKRDIVGQTIRMNGEPYTVIGIMPPGQMDRMPNQLWVPLSIKPDQINHDFHWLLAMGRLKEGVSIKQAQTDMDRVTKHIGEVYPQDKGWGASVEPLRNDFLPKEEIQGLYFLMGGVAFVLLIACANVTNLLLARGTAREREIVRGQSRFVFQSRHRPVSSPHTSALNLILHPHLASVIGLHVRGGGRGYQNGGPPFANLSPRLSLFSDHLRTVLAVKGSLRRAQQRRALDGSGPFRTTLLRRGKGSLRTAPLAGDHFAAILVPFFSATDSLQKGP